MVRSVRRYGATGIIVYHALIKMSVIGLMLSKREWCVLNSCQSCAHPIHSSIEARVLKCILRSISHTSVQTTPTANPSQASPQPMHKDTSSDTNSQSSSSPQSSDASPNSLPARRCACRRRSRPCSPDTGAWPRSLRAALAPCWSTPTRRPSHPARRAGSHLR